jgi:hypothetical protein
MVLPSRDFTCDSSPDLSLGLFRMSLSSAGMIPRICRIELLQGLGDLVSLFRTNGFPKVRMLLSINPTPWGARSFTCVVALWFPYIFSKPFILYRLKILINDHLKNFKLETVFAIFIPCRLKMGAVMLIGTKFFPVSAKSFSHIVCTPHIKLFVDHVSDSVDHGLSHHHLRYKSIEMVNYMPCAI